MIAAALGTTVLALLAAWLLGGLVLRSAGVLLILAGAVGLAGSGDANAALLLGIGALVWWAGQLLYALRHGIWKSRLAERLGGAALAAWRRIEARLGAHRANPSPDEQPGGG